MTATRYGSVTKGEQYGRTNIHFDIDQFIWYSNAVRRTLDCESKDKLLSAVMLHLPYILGVEAPFYLLAVGDGLNVCDAYLAAIGGVKDLLTGKTPQVRSRLWKLFGYNGVNNRSKALDFSLEEMASKFEFNKIFTTHIAPFLKECDVPLDHTRTYDFQCSCVSFDRLIVTADNREDRSKQSLEVVFVPDKRNGKPRKVVGLTYRDGGWLSEGLESRVAISEFTLADSTNALGDSVIGYLPREVFKQQATKDHKDL